MKKIVLLVLILWISSCQKETTGGVISSSRFAVCNEVVSERCTNFAGDYCLFGFKWGEDSSFSTVGINAMGPKKSGGLITYSFQEENGFVNTHKQINVPSLSFNRLENCAKTEIRRAMESWAAVANIQLEEVADNSSSDLKLFVAEINTGGTGYPNFQALPCNQLAGHIILHPDFTSDCKLFYLYALHEIGHALGLGHSSKSNVMGANFKTANFESLQSGDIEGIQQIYGIK